MRGGRPGRRARVHAGAVRPRCGRVGQQEQLRLTSPPRRPPRRACRVRVCRPAGNSGRRSGADGAAVRGGPRSRIGGVAVVSRIHRPGRAERGPAPIGPRQTIDNAAAVVARRASAFLSSRKQAVRAGRVDFTSLGLRRGWGRARVGGGFVAGLAAGLSVEPSSPPQGPLGFRQRFRLVSSPRPALLLRGLVARSNRTHQCVREVLLRGSRRRASAHRPAGAAITCYGIGWRVSLTVLGQEAALWPGRWVLVRGPGCIDTECPAAQEATRRRAVPFPLSKQPARSSAAKE